MSHGGAPPRWGFDDAELADYPTVYRADLLAGQVALISGGGTGLGRALAYLFARMGAEVMICGRRREKLDETRDRGGNPQAPGPRDRRPGHDHPRSGRGGGDAGRPRRPGRASARWTSWSTTAAASSRSRPSTIASRAGRRSSTPTSTAPGT